MIVIIDNYDSFTYNLVQYVAELGNPVESISVFRNDVIDLSSLLSTNPSHIIISPGPCTPNEAGISLDIVRNLAGKVPILGVCLGHQAIGQAWGGDVVRARIPVHGKISEIYHSNQSILDGLPNPFPATRYHSLIVRRETLPDCLETIAWTDDGEVMALRHREYFTLIGVQFHPESILTACGKALLRKFLDLSLS